MPLEHLDRPSMRAPSGGSLDRQVLVVEDDPTQQQLIADQLERHGYHVEVAASGAAAQQALGSLHPDAAIVDLGLPDTDGVDLCRRIAIWPGCPVVVVSGDHDDHRIVAALDAGASDYVTKPYSEAVLDARLRAAIRDRDPAQRTIVADILQAGDLVLDIGAHQAFVDGEPIDLHARPFGVLELLMRQEGALVPLATLVGRPRGTSPTAEELRALRIVISRIRKAIGVGPRRPALLTEHRVGYRLARPDAEA
jgi:two-component system KDP operon response regulator KdpE